MATPSKRKREDVDPDYDDYEDVTEQQTKRQKILEKDGKEATIKRIEKIVDQQFSMEITAKEQEIITIDSRLHEAKKMMDRLRACIVASYFSRSLASNSQSERNLPPPQPVIHPAVKKHLGKTVKSEPTAAGSLHGPSDRSAAAANPQTKAGKQDGAEKTVSTVKSSAKEVSSSKVLESPRRGARFKEKKRIIVGNVSRYIPVDKRDENDQATHKWMVYVRGSADEPDISPFVSKVWFFLHPSYRPNDLVEISTPPFHLTRRGWGEFPIRVQLNFKESRNKRVDIVHQIKLDRTYTGLQTLGSETVVDVEIERDLELCRRSSSKKDKTAAATAAIPSTTKTAHEPMEIKQEEPDETGSIHSLHQIMRTAIMRKAESNDSLPESDSAYSSSQHSTTSEKKISSSSHVRTLSLGGAQTPLSPSFPATPQQSRPPTPNSGWTHVQIKSEPSTPDRPNSACSAGFQEITSLSSSSPDKCVRDLDKSVTTSSLPCTPDSGGAKQQAERVTTKDGSSVVMNISSKTAGQKVQRIEIGSMGGVKPLTGVQDSTIKQKAASNVTLPSSSVTQQPNNQTLYVKCKDASGKMFLVPQHLLVQKQLVLSSSSGAIQITGEQAKSAKSSLLSSVSAVSPSATVSYVLTSSTTNPTVPSKPPTFLTSPQMAAKVLPPQILGAVQKLVQQQQGKSPSGGSIQLALPTAQNSPGVSPKPSSSSSVIGSSPQLVLNQSGQLTLMSTSTLKGLTSLSPGVSSSPAGVTAMRPGQVVTKSPTINKPSGGGLKPPTLVTVSGQSVVSGQFGVQQQQKQPQLTTAAVNSVKPGGPTPIIVQQIPRSPGQGGGVQNVILQPGKVPAAGILLQPQQGAAGGHKAAGARSLLISPTVHAARLSSAQTSARLPQGATLLNPRSSVSGGGSSIIMMSSGPSGVQRIRGAVNLIRGGGGQQAVVGAAPAPRGASGGGVSLLRPGIVLPGNRLPRQQIVQQVNFVNNPVSSTGGQVSLLQQQQQQQKLLDNNKLQGKIAASVTMSSSVQHNATMAASALSNGQKQISLLSGKSMVVDNNNSGMPVKECKSLFLDSSGNNSMVLGKIDGISQNHTSTAVSKAVSSATCVIGPGQSLLKSFSGNTISVNTVTTSKVRPVCMRNKDVVRELDNREPKREHGNYVVPSVKLANFCSMADLVGFLVRYFPLINPDADKSVHPYCAHSVEEYLHYHVGKRRAKEWSRACAVRRELVRALSSVSPTHGNTDNNTVQFHGERVWTKRQIVIWCRNHQYSPLDTELRLRLSASPRPPHLAATYNSLSPAAALLDELQRRCVAAQNAELTEADDSDEGELDIVNTVESPVVRASPLKSPSPRKSSAAVLHTEVIPPTDGDTFVQDTAGQIGIQLRPVDVEESPFFTTSVLSSTPASMIWKATERLMEDVIRKACAVIMRDNRAPEELTAHDVCSAIKVSPNLDFLTNQNMAVSMDRELLRKSSDQKIT